MWEVIKHKLAKLGCFALIALMMVAVTAISKLVLGWFRPGDAGNDALSGQIGESVGKGFLGLAVLLGFILMGRQLIAELRGKQGSPPAPSSGPPPLPTQEQQSNDKGRNS